MDYPEKLNVLFSRIGEWSLYMLIFALPFSKSIVEITIVTALISFIAKRVITKNFLIHLDKADIFLLAYMVISLFSLSNSINSPYAATSVRAFFSKTLKFAALFFITREIIDDSRKLIIVAFVAALSVILILTDGFIQYFFTHIDLLHGYPSFKYRFDIPDFLGFPTASFPFPNDYAAWILIFIFPLGLFALLGKNRFVEKLPALAITIGLLYSLMLTKVRGAWLGFLVALGLLSLLKLKKLGVVLLVLFLVAAVFVNKSMISDILSLASVNDRSDMWKTGWKIFEEHPIIGNGVNTFFNKYMDTRQDEWNGKKGSYAHNCYLQMAADIGLAGLVFFLLFIIIVIAKGFKLAANIKDPLCYFMIIGISSGLVAFLVHSAVDTNLYSLPLAALFWLSAGLVPAIIGITQKKKS